MADLSTSYLGLTLSNPFIASSSGLSDSAPRVKHLADAGAGAIVLKSLFEEQILSEANRMSEQEDYPEAADYIQGYIQSHEVDKYVDLIEASKKETNCPIIPSISCVEGGQWVEFAQRMEQAGADALEVNIFFLPTDPSKPASEYESHYFSIAQQVVKKVKIPVSIKLSRNFTNPLYVMQKLQFTGVKGVVLFNRYYEPDIDLSKMELSAAEVFSTPHELAPTLRWLGLASAKIENLDLAASTGIHTAEDAVKAILSGANATQVCTVLYKHGPNHITSLIKHLDELLDKLGVASVNELRGKLNYAASPNPSLLERSQFMKYFSSRKEE